MSLPRNAAGKSNRVPEQLGELDVDYDDLVGGISEVRGKLMLTEQLLYTRLTALEPYVGSVPV